MVEGRRTAEVLTVAFRYFSLEVTHTSVTFTHVHSH